MTNPYKVEKQFQPNLQPKEIRKIGAKELKITWSDDHVSVYSFLWLRQNCQCALCIDEWSGQPLLAREKVPQDIEGLKVSIVGQYAVSIQFSDGHSTGIYLFTLLRKICPCGPCLNLNPPAESKKYLDKEDLRTKQ